MAKISRSLLERIVADLRQDPSRERCGLLLGGRGHIDDYIAAANVHTAPERHFELDPAVLLAVMRAQRLGGMSLVGHAHSHPGGASKPSSTDAATADSVGRLWLICGDQGPQLWCAVAGGSHLGAFEPVALTIIDEA